MNSYNRTLFNNNHSSFNITNSNNTNSNITTHNYTTVNDEELRVLSWISPLESWKRHSDVARVRAEGVGEWLLQSSQFQAWWRDGNGRSVGRILFGCGAPGAGKTFICSLVIDTLCDRTPGPNVAVGSLYCDYRGQKEQTPEVMIGSLLGQFVTALPGIPEAIKKAFQVAKSHLGGRTLELAKIIELFPGVLERFHQVFICVDALDEFVVDHRASFLASLRQILAKSPNTKLFLTARPHMQPVLETNVPLNITTITIQPLFSDIERYLIAKLDTDPHRRAMDDGLRSEILTKILEESSEIFLLVKLQVDSILGEVTIGGRRKKLREMTNNLSGAYTDTLERIRSQCGALTVLGISALMWISSSERPLLIDELCHALAVEVGSPNINPEMVPEIETVVASCMGLVIVDHASSTVRLVHATLEEYLRNHQDNVFPNAHATITEVCLSYLGIQSVRDLPSNLEDAPHAFPLLAYASSHWGAHARKQLTPSVRHLALGILEQYPQHVAANIFLSNGGARWYRGCSSAGFSGLHYVAYFGIEELVEALLSMELVNPNLADGWDRTPLILAAERGNNGVTTILLSRVDINPELRDWLGVTPLFQASANGHEAVVEALLANASVDSNSADQYRRTPLFQASENGHEGVVKTLLSRADINPNSPDSSGRTPLHAASVRGHTGVVRILLSRDDVSPNPPDVLDWTPLIIASSFGHEAVVETLLANASVDSNSADQYRQTPLFQASGNGHEGVVKTLLSRADINPNLPDWRGRTPLFKASENGHEAVVEALIANASVDPNSASQYSETPLLRASERGHSGVVRILLSRADINPNLPDWRGRTPLFQASENGHEASVEALLTRADVNPNSADSYGQTPLLQASEKGQLGAVSILLSRADVNPNSSD